MKWQQQAATRISCQVSFQQGHTTVAAATHPTKPTALTPRTPRCAGCCPPAPAAAPGPPRPPRRCAGAWEGAGGSVGGSGGGASNARGAPRAGSRGLCQPAAAAAGWLSHLEAATRRLFFLSVILGPPDSSLIALQVLPNPKRARNAAQLQLQAGACWGAVPERTGFQAAPLLPMYCRRAECLAQLGRPSLRAHLISRPASARVAQQAPGRDPPPLVV